MKRLLKNAAPTIVAVAVCSALTGGAAYAAAEKITSWDIKDNTIKTQDIQNGQVKSADLLDNGINTWDIAPNAVIGSDIRDGTVTKGDLNLSLQKQLTAKVADGAKGEKGEPGLANVEADGPYGSSVPADEKAHVVFATCADGKVAIGGGYRFGAVHEASTPGEHMVIPDMSVQSSEPTQVEGGKLVVTPIEGDAEMSILPNAWAVEVVNSGEKEQVVRPFVVCANVAG